MAVARRPSWRFSSGVNVNSGALVADCTPKHVASTDSDGEAPRRKRQKVEYTFQQALAEGSADAIEKCHALEMKRFKAEYKRGDSQTYGSGPALFCQDVSEICVDA